MEETDLPDHGEIKDLQQKTLQGSIVVYFSQALKLILGFVTSIIIARQLSPDDYGVVAMVTPIVGFFLLFSDLGSSLLVIQKKQIGLSEKNSLFWMSVISNIAIALILCLVAPLLVIIYDEPRVLMLTLAYAGIAIIGGLSIQHRAILVREMQFKKLAVIEIVALTIASTTGIVLAISNANFWAIVATSSIKSLVETILLWLFSGWHPSGPNINHITLEMFHFGANITGFGILNHLGRNLDDILIGWRLGTEELGLYTKAYNLLLLPLEQIRNPLASVILPALSRLQDDPEGFRKYYLNALFAINYVSIPLITTTAMISRTLIPFLLGEQWIDSSQIFLFLSIASMVQTIYTTAGWLFISTGHPDKLFRWALIAIPINIISYLVGLRWGGVGVAACYSFANILLIGPGMYFATKDTVVSLLDILNATKKPFLMAFISSGIVVALGKLTILDNLLFLMTVFLITIVIMSIGLLFPWKRSRFVEFRNVINLILARGEHATT